MRELQDKAAATPLSAPRRKMLRAHFWALILLAAGTDFHYKDIISNKIFLDIHLDLSCRRTVRGTNRRTRRLEREHAHLENLDLVQFLRLFSARLRHEIWRVKNVFDIDAIRLDRLNWGKNNRKKKALMEIFSFSSQCCYWNRRWGHKVEHNGLAAVMDLRAI